MRKRRRRASAAAVSSRRRHSSRASRTRGLNGEAGKNDFWHRDSATAPALRAAPDPVECGLADLPRGPGQGCCPGLVGPQNELNATPLRHRVARVARTEWKTTRCADGTISTGLPLERPFPGTGHRSPILQLPANIPRPLLRSSMGRAAASWRGPELQSVPSHPLVAFCAPCSGSCFPLAGVAACASAGTTTEENAKAELRMHGPAWMIGWMYG